MPVPPNYTEPLLELISRFATEAHITAQLPRQLDAVIFERLVRRRNLSPNLSTRLNLTYDSERLIRLIAAFLRGQIGLPAAIEKVLATPLFDNHSDRGGSGDGQAALFDPATQSESSLPAPTPTTRGLDSRQGGPSAAVSSCLRRLACRPRIVESQPPAVRNNKQRVDDPAASAPCGIGSVASPSTIQGSVCRSRHPATGTCGRSIPPWSCLSLTAWACRTSPSLRTTGEAQSACARPSSGRTIRAPRCD